MTTEVKRLIRVRTDKGASFKRDGFGKKRQLSDSWRKPRGQHNKQREQKKAKGALPKPGFGSPVAVRGMHPSGFFEVLVASAKDLEGLDSQTQAVRISATVGDRKRVTLQESAVAAGFKVLNARIIKTALKVAPAKEESKATKETKPVASKAPAKKVTPAGSADKKVASKPAAKSAKPKAEKPAEAAPSAKPKAAYKPAAKPKAEKPAEAPSAKPKTDAKAKPKAKKSEVKKND
jgi:large subunit ribosomal protein L32e